jgi:hypothetical protein
MENGTERRATQTTHKIPSMTGGQPTPEAYRGMVDTPRPEKKVVRDLSLEWITDAKSGAETAAGIGGFRYRIYTTEELGTCCMYLWPGHFITTHYGCHDEGKQAMNDHYEALCYIREESVRELAKENDALKKRIQVLSTRPPA